MTTVWSSMVSGSTRMKPPTSAMATASQRRDPPTHTETSPSTSQVGETSRIKPSVSMDGMIPLTEGSMTCTTCSHWCKPRPLLSTWSALTRDHTFCQDLTSQVSVNMVTIGWVITGPQLSTWHSQLTVSSVTTCSPCHSWVQIFAVSTVMLLTNSVLDGTFSDHCIHSLETTTRTLQNLKSHIDSMLPFQVQTLQWDTTM